MKNSIAEAVIEVLMDLVSFDGWWGSIDDDDQEDIVAEINHAIGTAITEHMEQIL